MAATLWRVKVRAGDKRDLLVCVGPNAFSARVRAKPKQGRANQSVLALLGRHLGIDPKRLRIIKGSNAPSKIVTLLGGS
jgi:uncharacterized protein YggU (UPF0235/DUF167 family)